MKLIEIQTPGVTNKHRDLDAYVKTQKKKEKIVPPVTDTEKSKDSTQKRKDGPLGQHIDTYA